MTYLLDTHTFIWLVSDPEVLPDPVLEAIRNPAATILVSIVVPWEIAIKTKIGKLNGEEVLKDFESKCSKSKLSLLQTSVQQVIRAGSLPLHHRDPFDRLLIAQAFELGVPILSNDVVLDSYGVSRTWD